MGTRNARDFGAAGPDASAWRAGWGTRLRAVHPDCLRVAMFELLEEAGCHYRLYSPVTGAAKEGNRVTAWKFGLDDPSHPERFERKASAE